RRRRRTGLAADRLQQRLRLVGLGVAHTENDAVTLLRPVGAKRPADITGADNGDFHGYRTSFFYRRPRYTIILPSSVTALSRLSAASPRIISLCARPEGIIGKQFSFGSTTQSNSTGASTSIICLIAAS